MENQTVSTISIKISIFRQTVENVRIGKEDAELVQEAKELIQLSDIFGGEYVNVTPQLLKQLLEKLKRENASPLPLPRW